MQKADGLSPFFLGTCRDNIYKILGNDGYQIRKISHGDSLIHPPLSLEKPSIEIVSTVLAQHLVNVHFCRSLIPFTRGRQQCTYTLCGWTA